MDVDYITCGLCQREFILSNMSPFLKHKVNGCKKEEYFEDKTNLYLLCNINGCSSKFYTAVSMLIHLNTLHEININIQYLENKVKRQSLDWPENEINKSNKSGYRPENEINKSCSCCGKGNKSHSDIEDDSVSKVEVQSSQKTPKLDCGSDKGNPCPCEMRSMTIMSLGDSLDDVSKNAPCLSIDKNKKCGSECGDTIQGTNSQSGDNENIPRISNAKCACGTEVCDKPTQTLDDEIEVTENDCNPDNYSPEICSQRKCCKNDECCVMIIPSGGEVCDKPTQTLDDEIEVTENDCNPDNCSPEICSQRKCCNNDDCCVMIIPSGGISLGKLRKCCSSVIPKKRKQHFEQKHLSDRMRLRPSQSNDVEMVDFSSQKLNDTFDGESFSYIDYDEQYSPTLTSLDTTAISELQNYPPNSMTNFMENIETDVSLLTSSSSNFVNIENISSQSYDIPVTNTSVEPSEKLRTQRQNIENSNNPTANSKACQIPTLSSKTTENKNEGSRDSDGKRRYPTYKPFKCETCGKGFNQNIHLKKHLSVHTGLKPFSCNECSYSTVEKSHLKVHMRIHTGEKPFKCQYCDFATAQNSALTIHIKRKHKQH